MRSPVLQQAIDNAGGLRALARAIKLTHPSVAKWTRVPAERVLLVEAASGIHRCVLRPDIYPPEDEPK